MSLSSFVLHHKKWTMSIALILAITGVALATVERSSPVRSLTKNGIPLPFGVEGSRLTGAVTFFEKRNNIDIYEVTFTAGETHETFQENKIYLVHTPAGITASAMDNAFVLVNGGRAVNYFGYKYMDATAGVERAHINDTLFKDRFPGQFFASAKSRVEDVTHGNTIATFTTANGVTFLPSDASANGVQVAPSALYVFVVNEHSGANFYPGTVPAVCGNSFREGTEQCDDGNQIPTDACKNDCTGNAGLCGNGTKEGAEECDDGNMNTNDVCKNDCTAGLPIPFDAAHGAATQSSQAVSSSVELSAAVAVCGNGTEEAPEQCDNGTQNGVACTTNGCSYCSTTCVLTRVDIQVSSSRSSSLSTIVSACGNGKKEGTEQCDDGNMNSSDGCSESCSFEANFSCAQQDPTTPAICVLCSMPSCLAPREGCTYTPPQAVPGQCVGCGTVRCEPVTFLCGDGVIGTGETCDQGSENRTSGDGCSALCAIEQNYRCTGTPSICISYLEFVRQLSRIADADSDDVKQRKALSVSLDLYSGDELSVSQYDINNDGVLDTIDKTLIFEQLDILAP
jgi:cysteine-rich repeat protein